MKKLQILTAITLLATMFESCSKNIEVDPPTDQLTTAAVFTDSTTAVAAVSGVYAMAIKANSGTMSFLNGFPAVLTGLSADELVTTTTNAPYDEFAVNSVGIRNTLNTNNWNDAYAMIFLCNLIIENLEQNNSLTNTLKNQLAGEMRFMRALNYFYLTNEYGRVPLILTSDYKQNTAASNTDTVAIYAQMVKDLSEAKDLLFNAYPGPGTEKIRANKLAASALLARVYLYQKDYAKAATEASAVISSNLYSLTTDLKRTFLANNEEAIMQLAPSIALFMGPAESYFLLPGNATSKPAFQLRPELVNAFEANDQRKSNWVGSTVVSGVTYYYLNKAKIKIHPYNTAKPESNIVLRLAEQYLIRAEAYAQQDKLTDAIKDVDKIRGRAGLPLIADNNPNISKQDLLKAIMQENRIEFFLEWGHRWMDLKRTGMASPVLATVKGAAWQATDVLYPIPANEILTAPNLKQNDGYAK